MGNGEFDLCGYCCRWANDLEGKPPTAVRDAYPKMMRKVLKHEFGIPKKAAKRFVSNACYGNWLKLHETDVEREADGSVVWRLSERELGIVASLG